MSFAAPASPASFTNLRIEPFASVFVFFNVKTGLLDVELANAPSAPSYVKLSFPANAFAPFTVVTLLSVDPDSVPELVPAPISDLIPVPAR